MQDEFRQHLSRYDYPRAFALNLKGISAFIPTKGVASRKFLMIITDKQIRDSILERIVQYKTFTGEDILKHLYDEPAPSKLFIDQTVRRIHTAIRSIVKWSPLGAQYKYTSAFSKSDVTMRPELKPRLVIEALDENGKHINLVYTGIEAAQTAFDQLRESREIRSANLFNVAGSERIPISRFKRSV